MIALPVPLVMKHLMVILFRVVRLCIFKCCQFFWNFYKFLWMVCAIRSFIYFTIKKMSIRVIIKEFRHDDVAVTTSNDWTSFTARIAILTTVV